MKISQNGMRQLPDGVLSEALATRQPGKPRYTNYLQFESMVTASLVWWRRPIFCAVHSFGR
ncbi:hypothetical protein BD777DRAFT_123554 [Yarrowia lipolytica]|nr:hypothetical protein BD777DRAFT_123554 [Yarrowia lipolytica]